MWNGSNIFCRAEYEPLSIYVLKMCSLIAAVVSAYSTIKTQIYVGRGRSNKTVFVEMNSMRQLCNKRGIIEANVWATMAYVQYRACGSQQLHEASDMKHKWVTLFPSQFYGEIRKIYSVSWTTNRHWFRITIFTSNQRNSEWSNKQECVWHLTSKYNQIVIFLMVVETSCLFSHLDMIYGVLMEHNCL